MLESFAVSFHATISVYAESIMENIEISKGRYFTDFGKGFYLTNNLEQAEKWASQKYRDNQTKFSKAKPAIVKLKLDEELLKMYLIQNKGIVFDSPDGRWSEFVYYCRKKGRMDIKHHSYSLVCGPLADGKIVPLLNQLDNGEITQDQFTEFIKPRKHIKNQLSFHTEDVLECIINKEVLTVEKFKLQPR